MDEPKWEAEPEYALDPRCKCLCCWEETGRWQIDNEDVSKAPFVIGDKDEAELLAEFLNSIAQR